MVLRVASRFKFLTGLCNGKTKNGEGGHGPPSYAGAAYIYQLYEKMTIFIGSPLEHRSYNIFSADLFYRR